MRNRCAGANPGGNLRGKMHPVPRRPEAHWCMATMPHPWRRPAMRKA